MANRPDISLNDLPACGRWPRGRRSRAFLICHQSGRFGRCFAERITIVRFPASSSASQFMSGLPFCHRSLGAPALAVLDAPAPILFQTARAWG